LLEARDLGGVLPTFPGRITLTVDAPAVRAQLVCPFTASPFCPGGAFTAALLDVEAVMEDTAPPAVVPPAVLGTPVRGATDVLYAAADAASGVADAALIVDGQRQPTVHDDNDGKCPQQQPYQFLVPCRLHVSSSLPLDTLGLHLSDGEHEVALAVEDASGQGAVSESVKFTVHNAPTNVTRPSVAGFPQVGHSLTAEPGTWAGSPTAFAFKWLRCPASVRTAANAAGCTPIPGAASRQYVPVAADIGQREMVEVTTTNASGSEAEFSGPSEVIADVVKGPEPKPPGRKPPDKTAPVLKHVLLSRKRLRLGGSPSAGRGETLLKFSSSEAGHLLIVIDKPRHGKKPKRIVTLAADIKAGRSAVPLGPAIGGKQLEPGSYRVTVSVRDAAGNVSKPASRTFRIVAG
jgi:hypothetical protein